MDNQKLMNLFRGFKGREKSLRFITRYGLYHTMFYRTNDFIHSKRVSYLVTAISPYAIKIWPNFNTSKAQIMALIHDDIEIVIGDIQAGNKSKMTNQQLSSLFETEKQAITKIAKNFPNKIGKYVYEELLNEIAENNTPESIVVKYADKMDAFGEALHEIYAGNYIFVNNVTNEFGKIPTPCEYYIDYFNKFTKKFPKAKKLLQQEFPLFKKIKQINFKKIAKRSSVHTKESILKKTGYEHYDVWKKIILKYGKNEEIKNLTKKQEFIAL